MSDKSTTASLIISKVFNEAKRVVNMNISSTGEFGIAAVLTGMTAFFIAGYRNDFDLCQELTPTYHKRIMPDVSKDEYDNYSYILNDAYTKFRETAIKHQNQSEDWASQMMSEFSEMLLVMLRANTTDYSRGLMLDEVKRLLEIAQKTGSDLSGTEKRIGSAPKEGEAGKQIHRIGKRLLLVLIIVVCVVYYYIDQVSVSYVPNEAIYHMREYYEDDDGYMDCYIKIKPGKEKNNENFGTFSVYLIDNVDGSGEYMPRQCYMMMTSCGYWKWKTLLGRFAVNNAGKKYDFIPRGYTRVDCYMAEGTSVGFDMFMEPLELDSIPAVQEIIDFGTNNFVYEGTVYNQISEKEIDEDSLDFINELESMMDEELEE